jgi:hypothetical protein
MALTSSTPRAFKEVPKDLREWTAWIRDAFVSSLTGTISTAQFADNSVTLAKLQNIATDTVLGRSTAGTGVPEQLVCTAAGRALIDDASAAAQVTTLGFKATANTWTLAQTFSVPPVVPSYTVAGVPSASPAGQLAYISNETGGAVLAFSDATNWRRVTDRAVIA